ncbi:hypothetical protein ACFQ07_02615 [Actinomadura adrarensis]|uniref:Uncharacterized protein n=1 Tax=Actinomadura adrarensis TaxID=1819600 RepID=A0ABW3CAY9_9ACTN
MSRRSLRQIAFITTFTTVAVLYGPVMAVAITALLAGTVAIATGGRHA